MTRIHAGGATRTGYKRRHNEDVYRILPGIGVAIVADGMGGYAGGEVASSLAVQAIEQALRAGKTLEQALENSGQDNITVVLLSSAS